MDLKKQKEMDTAQTCPVKTEQNHSTENKREHSDLMNSDYKSRFSTKKPYLSFICCSLLYISHWVILTKNT